jgi:hypothetical protein
MHRGFELLRLRSVSGARDEFHLAAIVQDLKTVGPQLLGAPLKSTLRELPRASEEALAISSARQETISSARQETRPMRGTAGRTHTRNSLRPRPARGAIGGDISLQPGRWPCRRAAHLP